MASEDKYSKYFEHGCDLTALQVNRRFVRVVIVELAERYVGLPSIKNVNLYYIACDIKYFSYFCIADDNICDD